VRPEQAGIASGTLNTTQRFAGAIGDAVISTTFFATSATTPTAGYARAAAAALWIGLALAVVITVLSIALAPARERKISSHPAKARETVR
jgi:hypothetical protein